MQKLDQEISTELTSKELSGRQIQVKHKKQLSARTDHYWKAKTGLRISKEVKNNWRSWLDLNQESNKQEKQ